MEWNLKYYIQGCPDWEHYYPYNHAPFISDIVKCLKYYKRVEFGGNKPCTPYEQLMCVLPVQSKD
jgi:5'-3' exoribonuclease 1